MSEKNYNIHFSYTSKNPTNHYGYIAFTKFNLISWESSNVH